jgi:hypothetical protein
VWLKKTYIAMRLFFLYSIFTIAVFCFCFIDKAFAKDTIKFIETTGRAVLEENEALDATRRRALGTHFIWLPFMVEQR